MCEVTLNHASSQVVVEVKVLPHGQGLPLPHYATPLSAGCDLRAAVDAPIVVQPGERVLVPTGMAIALPAGFEAQVRPRSGLAVRQGITVLNSPGTVDADYRGEVKVALIHHGHEPFTIERGARIAQMVVAPVHQVQWSSVAELSSTERGSGGFGSTGV